MIELAFIVFGLIMATIMFWYFVKTFFAIVKAVVVLAALLLVMGFLMQMAGFNLI